MKPERILSKKDLKAIIPYSATHLARLEALNQFPKRLKLGPNRVGWLESDIAAWQNDKKSTRDKN